MLKVSLAQKMGVSENRIKLTFEDKTLEPAEKQLVAFFSGKEAKVVFRDLGAQVGWRTVFLVEYAGPMLIMAAFALWRIKSGRLSDFQVIAALTYIAHFVKREMETVFVHRFSNETMPLLNIFANSGYYWGSAAVIAYFLTHPLYTPPPISQRYTGAALFIISQALNFYAHVALARLRPLGTKVRRVPRGFLFDQITCPNYTFEITAWIGFAFMTRILAAWVFALVSLAILCKWAAAKKRRYLKEFDGVDGRDEFPADRAILFPLVF
jgi:very-long-chain enoyl-CoA reductase